MPRISVCWGVWWIRTVSQPARPASQGAEPPSWWLMIFCADLCEALWSAAEQAEQAEGQTHWLCGGCIIPGTLKGATWWWWEEHGHVSEHWNQEVPFGLSDLLYLLSVDSSPPVITPTTVVSSTYWWSLNGGAVACVEGVQEGAQHTTLWGAAAEHQGSEVELTQLHNLWTLSWSRSTWVNEQHLGSENSRWVGAVWRAVAMNFRNFK